MFRRYRAISHGGGASESTADDDARSESCNQSCLDFRCSLGRPKRLADRVIRQPLLTVHGRPVDVCPSEGDCEDCDKEEQASSPLSEKELDLSMS